MEWPRRTEWPRSRVRKISKLLILAFEANSALPRDNETKIVKITHSATVSQNFFKKSSPKKLVKSNINQLHEKKF